MTNGYIELLGEQRLKVLDVGARYGFFWRFLSVSERTEILGFEPDRSECDRLNASPEARRWAKARVLPLALGSDSPDRRLFVTRHPGCTSLLPPNRRTMTSPDWDVVHEERIATISLDRVAEREDFNGPFDFIKLDTQASELEILQSGSARVLPHLLGVETEAAFSELYTGQARFSELELYLRGQGFALVHMNVSDHRRADLPLSRGLTTECDAIFLRDKEWLAGVPEADRLPVLHRLIVIYLLYDLFAEAVWIAKAFDADLLARIERLYNAGKKATWRWRLALLRDVATCLWSPTRSNRLALSRRAETVMDPVRYRRIR